MSPVLTVLLVLSIVLIASCTTKPETTNQQAPTQIIENISPQEAFTLIQENQDNADFAIIDVRTPGEFAEEHIENAVNIDFNSENFRDELDKLDRNKTYLIYCRSGNRSGKALEVMEKVDFREVYNMSGGITEWKAEGLPTVK
ncbi:MAG: rhodanese-like domain-containing protein [Chloroflexi bacterium]|nr:rhodanese-like domain-containing protein [Chloroflexota bacterium]